jgi:hypothetical protein
MEKLIDWPVLAVVGRAVMVTACAVARERHKKNRVRTTMELRYMDCMANLLIGRQWWAGIIFCTGIMAVT